MQSRNNSFKKFSVREKYIFVVLINSRFKKLRTNLPLFCGYVSLNCTVRDADDFYYSAYFTKYAKAS